jgi:uncharacterized protein YbaR (Trm112 family)
MVKASFLEILRCPACVQDQPADAGRLTLGAGGQWLICQDCTRKYPIIHDIPVMKIEVGTQWQTTPAESLPVPPPQPEP